VVDHGDADAGYVQVAHAVQQAHRVRGRAAHGDRFAQAIFDAGDAVVERRGRRVQRAGG